MELKRLSVNENKIRRMYNNDFLKANLDISDVEHKRSENSVYVLFFYC